MIAMPWRDPEVRQMSRESLSLVVQSEKILSLLEEHLETLQHFVEKKEEQQEGGTGGKDQSG